MDIIKKVTSNCVLPRFFRFSISVYHAFLKDTLIFFTTLMDYKGTKASLEMAFVFIEDRSSHKLWIM